MANLAGGRKPYVNCERLLKVQESNLLEEVRDLECGSVNELEGPLEKAYWRFTAKDGASLGPWPRMDKIQSTGGAFSVPNRARRLEIGSLQIEIVSHWLNVRVSSCLVGSDGWQSMLYCSITRPFPASGRRSPAR
jgi:hypothetical protein